VELFCTVLLIVTALFGTGVLGRVAFRLSADD
jgi:hypothetical protein